MPLLSRIISRLVMATFAIAVIPGCKEDSNSLEDMKEQNRKEMAPILEKHRAAATAMIETIKAIGEDAKTAPPVETREPPAGTIVSPEYGEPETAGILLANIEWTRFNNDSSLVYFKTDFPISVIHRALKDGHCYDTGYHPAGVGEKFAVLTGLKQVAVIRIRRYDAPKAVFAVGQQRFEGGEAVGDVLIYDTATRKRIAGFPFEVHQHEDASISRSASEETVQRELSQSFASNFNFDMRRELHLYASGKTGPATPGAAAVAEMERFSRKINLDLSMEHLLAGIKKVDIVPGAGGKLVVTIHAETPRQLTTRDGKALPDVQAIVAKILGVEPEIKFVKVAESPATRPATPE